MSSSSDTDNFYSYSIHVNNAIYQRRTPLNIDDKKNVGEIFNSLTESRPFTNLDQKRCKVFLMPANEVASLYTKEGKVKAGNQYSLNLSLEVKFEEKRKFRKLKKYVASTNILHLHFELQTEVKKKSLKLQLDAFSQIMKKSQKKNFASLPEKNDSEGLKNTVRNHIIDLTRDKGGSFSVIKA